MRITTTTLASAIASIALSTGSWASPQAPSFEGLGFLPTQVSPWSEAHGVSEDGETIIGFARQSGHDWASEPFVWTSAQGMTGLGAPPLTSGTPGGRAYAVSGDGAVIVGATDFEVEGDASFIWRRNGSFAALDTVRGSYRSEALAVSQDASVIVGKSHFSGSYVSFPSHKEGIVWIDGRERATGLFPGGFQSEARGVSGDGRIVVGQALRSKEEGQTAFRWTVEQGLVSLGDLPGGYHFSRANDASHDGSVIVGYGTISFDFATFAVDHRACRWTASGVEELPAVPNTYLSEAVAVTPDGQTAVGWARAPGDNRAAIWDPIHGGRDIVTVMEASGVDMSDWKMTHATAVSADGHVVVGYGLRTSLGTREAFRAYLP
ncbi:MAG: putative membrane protein [Planctomycetota bacterium]|jgi:uncharacterized membrane protein